jgi:hypothetical protein
MRFVFRSVPLALLAVLAVSAAASASASASPEWQLNGKPVTKATATTLSSAASGITVSNSSETIKCSLSGSGEVAEKGKGAITKVTLTKCHFTTIGLCKTQTQKEREEGESHEWVKVAGPRWSTQLNEEDNDVLVPSESINFSFTYECTNFLGLGKVKVECHNPSGVGYEIPAFNDAGLLLQFANISKNTKNRYFECNEGGNGVFEGNVVMNGSNGETLSIT